MGEPALRQPSRMREISRQDFGRRETVGLDLRVECGREFAHDGVDEARFGGAREHFGLVHGVVDDLGDEALVGGFALSLDQFKTRYI